MKDMVGKLVFVESIADGVYPKSCELVCIRASESTILGVPFQEGYGGHEMKSFSLVGKGAYEIVNVDDNEDLVRDFAETLIEWSKSKEKNWMESVYSGAGSNGRRILIALDSKKQSKPLSQNQLDKSGILKLLKQAVYLIEK